MPCPAPNSNGSHLRPTSSSADNGSKRPFQLLRYFVLTSLIIIIATAALVQFFYRRAVVDTVVNLGEATNITLAQTALLSIRSEVLDYLRHMADASPEQVKEHSAPPEFEWSIRHLMNETAITRAKVYNRRGVVIYSTLPAQIGQSQEDNSAFRNALLGKKVSELVYRDSLNPFDKETADDNLIQSYLPVKDQDFSTVLGVFEIYTDVNPLVLNTERSQLLMLPTLIGIFLLMFVLLVAIVRRAAAVINRQESIIRERTHMLEFLTAQMLTTQEDEKKSIAHGLHESVAQTLSAVKMRLETLTADRKTTTSTADPVNDLIGFLQDAISETSSMATRLRPSSLDDFGLLETLDWFISDLRERFPQIAIEHSFDAKEEEIPRPLKIIIYRIVQDTLTTLAEQTEADKAKISLVTDGNNIRLELEENSHAYSRAATNGERLNMAVVPMRERTFLSCGSFNSRRARLSHIHTSHWET